MARTSFTGPIASGTKEAGISGGPNVGLAVLSQTQVITFDATLVQSATFYLPSGSQITSMHGDVTTAYNSATSATLSVGITAGGTEYASAFNAKTAGRTAFATSAAQAAAMANISTNTSVIATVTSDGQPTAGVVRLTIFYVQKDGA